MKNENNSYKFSLALDLGAKTTGVVMIHHPGNRLPQKGDCRAAAILMPEPDKFSYSTANRTAVRHRLRGKKRYALARRLVLLLVRERLKQKSIQLQVSEERKVIEALCGLLRRRGYNRLESEGGADLTSLESLEPTVFANHEVLGTFFQEGQSIAEQWENLTADPSTVRCVQELLPGEKDFKAFIDSEFPELKDLKNSYAKGLKAIREDAAAIDLQMNMGHKHRSKYLDAIRSDMQRDSRLRPIVEAFGGLDPLWRLIGNISNLQLRAHRWYFNAPYMLKEDLWEPERLQKTLIRSFKYFHCQKGEEARKNVELVREIESYDDVVEALCNIDPKRTIPPYEDQNNRRPPVDQTLWLSPSRLTERFGNVWKIWADAFRQKQPELGDRLDEILAQSDRRSRIPTLGGTPLSNENYELSYVLQRVLDRSKARDPYCLRALSFGRTGQSLVRARSHLESALGRQHVEAFLGFARDYYNEVNEARSGLWLEGGGNLLERADIHPPMKKRILNALVGNVFGEDEEFGRRFQAEVWNQPLPNLKRSKLRTVCARIEETRKQFGGEFNFLYRRVEAKIDSNEVSEKILKEEKDLVKICELVEKVEEYFRDDLQLNERIVRRMANPYSLAQLYTLIETERNGFSSTSIAAHLENQWRMSDGEDGMGAQCSRLPADAVRPFDGVLRKLLERQATELSHLVIGELQSASLKNATVDLAIVVEQNKFAFSASLAEVKKQNNVKKKAGEAENRQRKHWLSKDERIRKASREICAYTGKELRDDGEVDHIIPRSYSLDQYGTVLNSEANLIYVSREGNQKKLDARYRLSDLSESYLRSVFGTSDLVVVQDEIEKCIENLSHNGRIKYFDLLTQKEQDCVRHSLFLGDASDARRTVVEQLIAINRTRVNGTQAWLIRRLMEKILEQSTKWRKETNCRINFRSFKAEASAVSDIRTAIGNLYPRFKKAEVQPVSSHSMDALSAYAQACGSLQQCNYMGGRTEYADLKLVGEPEGVYGLYPDSCKIIRVESLDLAMKKDFNSMPLFKEGILGESFLPVLQWKGKIYVGFAVPDVDGKGGNSVEVKGKNPWAFLEILSPYLDKPIDRELSCCTYRVVPERAYELFSEGVLHPEKTDLRKKVEKDVLRQLLYVTERVPVASLFLKDGKQFVLFDKALDLKKFSISFEIKKTKDFEKIKGVLSLPALADWEALRNSKELKECWGKSKDVFDLEGWLAKKLNMNSGKSQHQAVRRVVSLPVVSSVSGGFRIRRDTLEGKSVYQLYNFNSIMFVGFEQENGVVNWKKAAIHPKMVHARLTPFEDLGVGSCRLIGFKEWRTVYKQERLKIAMAPWSKDRCQLRVEMPYTDFARLLKVSGYEGSLEDPTELHAEISLKKQKAKDFKDACANISPLLGEPRTNLMLECIGEYVTFRYGVMQTSAEMKSAYNAAHETFNDF